MTRPSWARYSSPGSMSASHSAVGGLEHGGQAVGYASRQGRRRGSSWQSSFSLMTSRTYAPSTSMSWASTAPGAGNVHARTCGSRAASGPAGACRRWRGGWHPCGGRPQGPGPGGRGASLPSSVEQLFGLIAAQPGLQAAGGAAGWVHVDGHLVGAEGALDRSGRPRPWGRSSPWGCAGRSWARWGGSSSPVSRALAWMRRISSDGTSPGRPAIVWCIFFGSSPSTKQGSQPQPWKKLVQLVRGRCGQKTVGLSILKPFRCRMGSTAPSSAGLRNLLECQAVARGPVSASPSPTTQAAIRSGLSSTAPKAWARE